MLLSAHIFSQLGDHELTGPIDRMSWFYCSEWRDLSALKDNTFLCVPFRQHWVQTFPAVQPGSFWPLPSDRTSGGIALWFCRALKRLGMLNMRAWRKRGVGFSCMYAGRVAEAGAAAAKGFALKLPVSTRSLCPAIYLPISMWWEVSDQEFLLSTLSVQRLLFNQHLVRASIFLPSWKFSKLIVSVPLFMVPCIWRHWRKPDVRVPGCLQCTRMLEADIGSGKCRVTAEEQEGLVNPVEKLQQRAGASSSACTQRLTSMQKADKVSWWSSWGLGDKLIDLHKALGIISPLTEPLHYPKREVVAVHLSWMVGCCGEKDPWLLCSTLLVLHLLLVRWRCRYPVCDPLTYFSDFTVFVFWQSTSKLKLINFRLLWTILLLVRRVCVEIKTHQQPPWISLAGSLVPGFTMATCLIKRRSSLEPASWSWCFNCQRRSVA